MTVAADIELGTAPSSPGRRAILPGGLFRYVSATSWAHQFPLLILTVAVFLLEVVPLELQRRAVNDTVKHRQASALLLICVAYGGSVVLQGLMKLGLNIYRAWVGERAKRDLRQYVSAAAELGEQSADAQGTAVAIAVAEVEPIGNFIGGAVSEPLLQAGILATVVAYIVHVDLRMGVVAIALFMPQAVFIPLMQQAMNRRAGARVWLLRQIGAGLIAAKEASTPQDPTEPTRIDRVFRINMRVFELKYAMNFLMNLCTHAQIILALLLGGWRVLEGDLEVGGIVAFISGISRLTDPWGDLVNYFRDLSVNELKYKLLAGAINDADSDAGIGDLRT